MGHEAIDAARERSRLAWVAALKAHVRAARAHAEAAALHERSPLHAELRDAELARLAKEREEFDAEVARHPEWANDVPEWPAYGTEPSADPS